MEPLVRAVLQVEKPGDKSLQIWVISPIPFCSTLCSNEASNFYIDLSKMFLGKSLQNEIQFVEISALFQKSKI